MKAHIHPVQLRRRRNLWTINDLADKAGFKSASIIKMIEAGICGAKQYRVAGLASAFGIKPNTLKAEIQRWEKNRHKPVECLEPQEAQA